MKFAGETKVAGSKLYKRRWFMLFLFMIYAFNGTQQWAQFTIINNLVTKYYNVTTTQVEWTTNVYTLSYIILVVPALYLIDLLGVRYTMILGAAGITVGNWIKVFSVAPDRFYVAFIGQTCSVSFLMLTYGLLGRFTAMWFGAKEISTAGVLAILGDQLGTAFAYFFPTALVKDGSEEIIGNGLKNMHLSVSITSTVIFILILFFFQAEPKLPPSVAQIKQKEAKQDKILPTLVKLMKKPAFLFFMVSYGFNTAGFFALSTCLNELIVINFPEGVNDAGNIGTLMMIAGMIGSLLVGKILDRTKLFKESAVFITICSTISMIIFTWSLKSANILYVYVAACLIGFLSAMASSLVVTIIYGYIIKSFGDLKSNCAMVGLYIIATIATFCIPVDLKRQRAENEPKTGEMKEFI